MNQDGELTENERPGEDVQPNLTALEAAKPPAVRVGARPRIGRNFRLQWEDVQKAWVLLYPEGMVKLNASAGEILKRCDGERTVAQIVAELESVFATTGLLEEVEAFCAIASRQGWIDSGAPAQAT